MYHGHMAMISGVDKAFGLLMDKLKKLNLMENTITLFSSDHGDILESFYAELPKQFPYDYSLHIPLFMKFPSAINPGSNTNPLLEHWITCLQFSGS